jgi:predicted nucleic acid-binding protein
VIVLDSSFLVAYHNERDVHHSSAVGVMGRVREGEWGAAILPEYVFLEVTTVIAARLGLKEAVATRETLLASEEVEFIPCSEFFLDSFDILRAQKDGGMSFAEAAIVAIARRRNSPFVATFDRDFRKVEGITVIPP